MNLKQPHKRFLPYLPALYVIILLATIITAPVMGQNAGVPSRHGNADSSSRHGNLAIIATASGPARYGPSWNVLNAIQRIMEEKKIADFLSPENFNDWRRTGFPALTIVPNAQQSVIPRRLIYPQSEINTNPQPQQSAKLIDRVWWDGQ